MVRQTTESPEIEAAIAAVQSGSMSLREAARKFDVPRTTLQRRVQRRASEASEASGSAPSEPLVVKAEVPADAAANAHSDTSNEDTAEAIGTENQPANVTGNKRSAEHLDPPSQGGQVAETVEDIRMVGLGPLS